MQAQRGWIGWAVMIATVAVTTLLFNLLIRPRPAVAQAPAGGVACAIAPDSSWGVIVKQDKYLVVVRGSTGSGW